LGPNVTGTVYHPELGQSVNWEAFPLSSDPDIQVAQTIQKMQRNVREDARSPAILNEAAAIRSSGSGDPLSDTFWWLKDRVRFRRDEELAAPVRPFLDGDVVEVLFRPRVLASMANPQEDCDGFASYGPALLRAQGIPCSFVTVAANPQAPGQFSHVYAACYPNGERVAFDASHGAYPGWECTESGQVTRLKEWSIDGPCWGELLLLAGVLFLVAKLWGVV
jgi:transglutaminase-like putative cysteine protease